MASAPHTPCFWIPRLLVVPGMCWKILVLSVKLICELVQLGMVFPSLQSWEIDTQSRADKTVLHRQA